METGREAGGTLMPVAQYFGWKDEVLWTNVAGDALIAISFFLIPFTLYYFVKKRGNINFRGIFLLFALFIFLCGVTHLLGVIGFWHPHYRLQGFVKLITGIVSVWSAISLIFIIPIALKIPRPQELEQMNKELEHKTNELRTQNKFLRNISYAMYHDLREPIRGMAINSQVLLLRHGDNLDAETKEIIEHVAAESKRLFSSIDSTLSLSFLESEKYSFGKVNLNAAVAYTLSNLAHLISENKAQIKSEHLPEITGNENLLCILFENIIANSIWFRGAEPPVIAISCIQSGNNYNISFSDNGSGFDNKYSEQIFEMFRRLGNSNSYRGPGLGLAISKRIVEMHGGSISATSQEGMGTLVTVTLPKG